MVIKTFSTKKSWDTDGFASEVYQIFEEELKPVLHKFFQKKKSFYEVTITLISKQKTSLESYRSESLRL